MIKKTGRVAMLFGLLVAALCGPAGPAVAATPSAQNAGVVLVTGATGRVGRYLIRELDAAGWTVRAMTRDVVAARARLGTQYQWVSADIRNPATLPAAVNGADYVVAAAGAVVPSGPNGPEQVDYEGNRNLIDAAVEAGVRQFIFISSIGVTQRFHLLNLTFGNVLHWKWKAEQHLRASGLNYTIIRPGGLRPGPAGTEGVRLDQGDAKGGSYIYIPDAAAVIAATVGNANAHGKTFELLSDRDQPPGNWRGRFATLEAD